MNEGNEITCLHEMKLAFDSTAVALACYRYMKEEGLANARMDWKDGKVYVIISKECGVDEWIKVLESFN